MKSEKRELPLVSVIIPTYNSEKTIAQCLESIKNQTYPNIEIIVVDGGSKDRTVEISKEMEASVYIVPDSKMSDATNFGIKKAKGKYIYRVDSDVVLEPYLIEDAVRRCERDGYDGVCVFWLPDESISFWAKVRKIEKESYINHPEFVGSIKYQKPVLGARFLKKDVFVTLGMMNENIPLAGEDYAFYVKLAGSPYKIGLISAKEKHLGEPKTLVEVFRKNFRYGCSLRSVFNPINSTLGSRRLVKHFSPFGRKYYIDAFKLALRKGPVYAFGLIIYEFVVYLSALAGLLYCLITGKGDVM